MPASDADLVARHLDAGGRLASMPVKHERRLLVLHHVASVIPIGVELDEFAVNNLLRPLYDDVAMLRRHLVNEGLLVRPEPGRYVRPERTTADGRSAPFWEDRGVKLRLTVRDLDAEDLGDLEWSGGPEHLQAIAEVLQAVWEGDVESTVIALSNGRLVAHGAVDFRKSPDSGELWMLSVHETLQSIGLGTRLVAALEAHVVGRGLSRARLSVEHDNPRALRLYRRLGYVPCGSRVESWPTSGGRTYVTVCTVMEHRLDGVPEPGTPDGVPEPGRAGSAV